LTAQVRASTRPYLAAPACFLSAAPPDLLPKNPARHTRTPTPLAPLITAGVADNLLRQYFVARCRANLHVLLVAEGDPPGGLARKVLAFPKLFQRLTINTVEEWDAEARAHVSGGQQQQRQQRQQRQQQRQQRQQRQQQRPGTMSRRARGCSGKTQSSRALSLLPSRLRGRRGIASQGCRHGTRMC
jgi:hypothetical protein